MVQICIKKLPWIILLVIITKTVVLWDIKIKIMKHIFSRWQGHPIPFLPLTSLNKTSGLSFSSSNVVWQNNFVNIMTCVGLSIVTWVRLFFQYLWRSFYSGCSSWRRRSWYRISTTHSVSSYPTWMANAACLFHL